ncbi:holin-like protein [Salirhabdus euzebyi]|uniref:Holin-like protein n=1 Tax=Salirhabdus euzebyi TaxID=394506 RepID=A0A841PZ19_9BACI|nr:CidA/LrgA family protein [Salirhabdus euzebyi]MBB6452461.1 holin-like protein [Salirhabdus euzebyi]
MKWSWVAQLFIIIGFLIFGYITVKFFHIPLPGSVVGMILLFMFLMIGLIKIEWIEKLSTFQLKHLTFLFIPPIVSLFISTAFLRMMHWNVLIIIVVSSICCLLASAYAVERYEKIKRRNIE